MPYISLTPEDVEAMLRSIGVSTIGDLFECIPPEARHTGPLGLPDAIGEMELRRELAGASAAITTADSVNSFLGGGAYDHYIPSIVDHLAGRTELYTSYTPYQPEASQGVLTAIFEYQSMIAALTEMEVSNASLYDGASGLAEAVIMALSCRKQRSKVVLAGTIHPEHRQTVRTYLANLDCELVTVEGEDGVISPASFEAAVDDRTACVAFQVPNFFGNLEDVFALSKAARDRGALVVASVDPISLGLVAPPGAYDADICVGEGQPLGAELSFGGPYFGFLAAKEKHLRRIPGRIVGETLDRDGRRGFVLAFQTREQHIRRGKATSNICTNQGIQALRGAIHLAALGPRGIRDVAELCLAKSHYAARAITAIDGFCRPHDAPYFKEFVIQCPRPAREIAARLARSGIQPGIPLERWFPSSEDRLLVAVTERKSREEIDALAAALAKAVGGGE